MYYFPALVSLGHLVILQILTPLLASESCSLLMGGLQYFLIALPCKIAFSSGQVLLPLEVMEIALHGGGH